MADVDLDALEARIRAAEEAYTSGPPTPAEASVEGYLLDQMPALIAELRRLRGQTCETCKWQRVRRGHPYDPYCGRTEMSDGVHITVMMVPCSFLGNGCRAHEPKAGARGGDRQRIDAGRAGE